MTNSMQFRWHFFWKRKKPYKWQSVLLFGAVSQRQKEIFLFFCSLTLINKIERISFHFLWLLTTLCVICLLGEYWVLRKKTTTNVWRVSSIRIFHTVCDFQCVVDSDKVKKWTQRQKRTQREKSYNAALSYWT